MRYPAKIYKQLLALFSCAGAFIYMLSISWLKWGDLIVDTGREMYAPLRIAMGAGIYRDFYYIYGPFSPYFNAGLFKAFGVKLSSLIAGGLIAAAACAFLIYKISRLFLGIFSSTLATITFILVFAFGHYVYYGNYNFIVPYSYGASHSIILALAAVYFFDAWLKGRRASTFLTALFITLALLSKIEVGAGVLLSVVIAGLFTNKRIKALTVFGAVPIIACAAVYLLLGVGLADFLSAVRPAASIPGWLSGADNIRQNAIIIAKSFFYYVSIVNFVALGGIIISKVKSLSLRAPKGRSNLGFEIASSSRRNSAGLLAMTIGAIFIACACFLTAKFFPFDWQYRALSLIIILGVFAAFKRSRTLVSLGIFSLLLLARVFFFIRPGHYGFYILVPGMIFYYIFFLELIPSRLPASVNTKFFKTVFIAIFIIFIYGHLSLSRFCYRQKTLEISTPAGTMKAFLNTREDYCRRLIDYLRAHTHPDETLVVFPEGPMVNFMAQRFNPLYYNMYMPLDLTKNGVTARVISEMEKFKVDYVAIAHRLGDEQGYPVFGLDYGGPVWDYIEQNYELEAQFGPMPFATPEFGAALYRRK